MEKSMNYPPAKRLKITYKQSDCSTLECLSGELIFQLFEYFNTNEILQSFSNLTSLITSCIFDRHLQLRIHLNPQMSSLPGNYSSNQVISLHIKDVTIPVGIFLNLKSLSIIYRDEQGNNCLSMLNEIFKLSQLINFRFSLVGSAVILISREIIQIALRHSSLQRIILSKNQKPYFESSYRNPSIKMVFPSVKQIYVNGDFCGMEIDRLRSELGIDMPLPFTPQYHIRYLNLHFSSWKLKSLVELVTALPSLITLKIKGFSCCGQAYDWIYIDDWYKMLENLKELQQVSIEIGIGMSMSAKEEAATRFNKAVAQKTQTCKRINLRVGRSTKNARDGCIWITASLNMD